MLNNCKYDKIKLIYKLSSICWFLEKHAIENAQQAGNQDTTKHLKELKDTLDKHLERLDKMCCK